MAEFSDDELLRLNDRTGVIPPDRLDAARRRQQIEGGATLRNLASILREEGFLTDTREEVLRSASPVRPGDPTRRLEGRPPSARRPQDVEEAARKGRRLGPFLLVEEVGRGGMGRVWRAWDEQVGRYVAVKVLEGGDPDARERFVREAQIAGRLAHANIAAVFQAGEDGPRGWIAMQFVDGAPVDAVPVPVATALARVRDAARALAYAHDQGVVHRDVKPGNILVDKSGRVFLTDFGLAKESTSERGAPMSITGAVLGTPQYMAPEQARGDRRAVGPLSDVYSLGATLYALLAGRPPFQNADVAALLVAVAQQPPSPLRRANPRISPELEDVVARAMEKRADRRWPSSQAFAEELDRLLREKRYEGRYGMARALARRWLPWAAGAVFLGLSLRAALPVLLAPPPLPSSVPGDVAQELLAEASISLGFLEGRPPEGREKGVVPEVLPRIDRALVLRPGLRRAQVLRARALVVAGRTSEARAALADLEAGDDYRVPYLRALLALEEALAAPPPLPALESPVFAWASPPARLDGVWRAEILKPTTLPPDLKADWARDRAAVEGLQALAAGNWGRAEERLKGPADAPIAPVLRRAWERAAYLARQFKALGPGAAVRERVGAGLATAVTSSDFERLRTATEGDAEARVALEVALARRRMDEGADPEDAVKAGEALLRGRSDAAAREHMGVLEVCRLCRAAGTGKDDEAGWRAAMAMLGESPSTPAGRLASVEARLGAGLRRMQRREDGRAWLEEAVSRADGYMKSAPEGWPAMRRVRAAAKARLGRVDEALTDLSGLERSQPLMALWSWMTLQKGERERRAGRAHLEFARAARRLALEGRSLREAAHPEVELAAGSAAVVLAEEDDEMPSAAVKELSAALEAWPGHGEAHLQRGRAWLLAAAGARRSGGEGRAESAKAAEDFDGALAACPESLTARHLRGVARFGAGDYDGALADWRALIAADGAWDTAELRDWMKHAEERGKGSSK